MNTTLASLSESELALVTGGFESQDDEPGCGGFGDGTPYPIGPIDPIDPVPEPCLF